MAVFYTVAMDTSHCWHWLLWTTLMFFMQHYQVTSGSHQFCPQGQLLHKQTKSKQLTITCCYPTRCGVGEEVKPCSVNGTFDTCVKCVGHQNQSLRTSSYTMDRCVDWPLDLECKSITHPEQEKNFNDEMIKRCMCNIEQGMKFDPPEYVYRGVSIDSYCQRRDDPCQPGFEPHVEGGCQPCRVNYFKSVVGFSLCEPMTNCTLLGLNYTFVSNATADSNCSKPDLVVVTKAPNPQRPVSTVEVTHTTTEATKQPSIVVSSTSRPDLNVSSISTLDPATRQPEGNKYLWPIIGSILALFVIVCILIGVFYCRRRKLLRCVYAAAKDCADTEDGHVQCSIYKPMNCQFKRIAANGSTSSQNLIRVDKNMCNGHTGGVHSNIEDLPNGHVNQNLMHGQSSHGNGDAVGQSSSPVNYPLVVQSRPGVLRAGKKCVMFGNREGNWPDLTLDIINQNGRYQSRVGAFEANSDVDESDCLLISEHPHQGIQHITTNLAGSVGSSPAVLPNEFNQVQILSLNGGHRDANFGHIILNKSQFLPAMRPNGQRAVPTDGATFTRSFSMITSPEGEVDEDERVVLFPRFSQLLQDGDDSSTSESKTNPTCSEISQQHPGLPLHLASFVPQKDHPANQPDHSIMSLKEQDLIGHSQPHLDGSCSVTMLKTAADSASNLNFVPADPDEVQQTQLKALGYPLQFSPSSDNDNITRYPSQHIGNKQSDCKVIAHNIPDRKKFVDNGLSGQVTHQNKQTNFQNSPNQKYISNGIANGRTIKELPRDFTGNVHERSYLKQSNSEDRSATKDKNQLNNRLWQTGDHLQNGSKQVNPKTDHRQPSQTQGTPELVNVNSKTFNSESDRTYAVHTNSSDDETLYTTAKTKDSSNTSNKVLVNSGSTEDSINGNPVTSTVYRRSQSHNAPSSSESAHKPPPRSMSEEKPQKLDRPVAKVKPMPASDSSVNQMPLDGPGDVLTQPPVGVTSTTSSTNILSSSTEESDQERHLDMNYNSDSTLEEDEEQETESETETTGV